MKKQLLTSSLILLVGTSLSFAQTSGTTGTTTNERPSSYTNPTTPRAVDPSAPGTMNTRLDRKLQDMLNKLSTVEEDELALSRLAAQRAIHPEVKTFANDMVTAHTSSNQELAMLVTRKGAKLEARDANDARNMEKKWAGKKGDEFDEDYLEAAIDLHEEKIDALEDGVDSKDADVSAFASKHMAVVKTHLERAKALLDRID